MKQETNLNKKVEEQSSPSSERIYKKYAWVVITLIGVLIMVGGIPHTLGVNSDPTTPESIIGMGLSEFEVSNPMFFDLYDFYFRAGGWSDIGFAYFVIVISATAYRKGEKWAWYTLWVVPVFFLGHAAITMNTGSSIGHLLPFLAVFTTLSVAGLLLPIRKIFPKEMQA